MCFLVCFEGIFKGVFFLGGGVSVSSRQKRWRIWGMLEMQKADIYNMPGEAEQK